MNVLTSVNKTIAYAKKYGGVLTEKQLWERLIGKKVYLKKQMPNVKFLISNKKNKYIKEKLEKAEKLAKLIEENFKDILFLGITGSVAAEYPKKNDDIDLMIITKNNKLWLTRLKLRYFIYKNNIPHRKYGQKERTDDFCFNLWLDENNLLLPKNRHHLKNAVDLILLKPLINKNKSYEKFINANSWAKKWVATGYALKPTLPSLENGGLKNNILSDMVINWLVFWPQFWYMKKRIKNERIGLREAFFHH